MSRKRLRRSSFYQDICWTRSEVLDESGQPGQADIGHSVRTLREQRGLSLRALADQSSVSVNTLSLIENGKSSPSVSTLQKISAALQVPLIAFFLPNQDGQKVIYTQSGGRKQVAFEHGVLEDLGAGLLEGALEPFVVKIEPQASSGPDAIVHTGYEFVFCLSGKLSYIVENQRYVLMPGDSLFFESHLPHCWQNLTAEPCQMILIVCPTEEFDHPIGRHFNPE